MHLHRKSSINNALELLNAGKLADAEHLLRQLLKKQPGNPQTQHMLAAVCHQTGRSAEARELLGQVLKAAPTATTSLQLMVRVLASLEQQDTAIEILNQYLRLCPNDSTAVNFKAQLRHQIGQSDEALADFSKAAAMAPNNGAFQHDFGIALSSAGRLAEAVNPLGAAAKLNPNDTNSHYHLAQALKKLGRLEDYYLALKKARSLSHGNLSVDYEALIAARHACDWEDLESLTGKLEKSLDRFLSSDSQEIIPPGPLNHLDINADLKSRVARRYAQQLVKSIEPATQAVTGDSSRTSKRICVGYLSTDFHNHAVGTLIYRLFECHDRETFTINAYSLRHRTDRIQETIAENCNLYKDLSELSDDEAAQVIRQDGVDILVDMAGYTGASRPLISARKPAVLVISYLGYLDTMGAEFVDYIVADPVVVPREHEARYQEKIIRLPHFMVTSPIGTETCNLKRSDYGLPEDRFVFCSFNQSYKLEPDSFACWMEILKQVKDSVLWIYASNRKDARSNLTQTAREHGVTEDRLIWAEIETLEKHLQRMALADLYLDTFQVSGGATLVSALYAGLPVLTLAGDTYLSRMGTSMNECLHMPELDCTSPDKYIQRAVELANNRDKVRALSERVREQFRTNRLFDTAQFARSLESAYRQAWQRHLEGFKPENIEISE